MCICTYQYGVLANAARLTPPCLAARVGLTWGFANALVFVQSVRPCYSVATYFAAYATWMEVFPVQRIGLFALAIRQLSMYKLQ